MNDLDRDIPPELRGQWQEWVDTEPAIDERELRRQLLNRIPERRVRSRRNLVLVVAAASLLAAIVGIESTRHVRAPLTAKRTEIGHRADEGVILILREGKEPIYVVTEPETSEEGVGR